jgi:hypothetical protein
MKYIHLTCECDCSTAAHEYSSSSLSTSHTQTDLSLLHVDRYLPDGAHATLFTSFSCPSSVAVHSKEPSLLSQTDTVPSNEAEAYKRSDLTVMN